MKIFSYNNGEVTDTVIHTVLRLSINGANVLLRFTDESSRTTKEITLTDLSRTPSRNSRFDLPQSFFTDLKRGQGTIEYLLDGKVLKTERYDHKLEVANYKEYETVINYKEYGAQ